MGTPGIQLRLVVAHPQNFGGRKACQRRVGGDLDETFGPHTGGDLLTLCGCALVAPDDGGPQHLSVGVQHHQAVHLPGNTDAPDLAAVHPGGHFLQRGVGGLPPVGGVLFRPAVLGLVHGVLHQRAFYNIALGVEQHGFGAAGAQVDPDQIFHFRSSVPDGLVL